VGKETVIHFIGEWDIPQIQFEHGNEETSPPPPKNQTLVIQLTASQFNDQAISSHGFEPMQGRTKQKLQFLTPKILYHKIVHTNFVLCDSLEVHVCLILKLKIFQSNILDCRSVSKLL
jgi:hypothetical protein